MRAAVSSAIDKAGLVIGDTVSVIAANTPEMFGRISVFPWPGAC